MTDEALRQRLDDYEAIFAAMVDGTELHFTSDIVHKCFDGKWRSDLSTYSEWGDDQKYEQAGWDSPMEAFQALYPNSSTEQWEWEYFFKSEPGEAFAIDGWFPITTERLKDPERIPDLIKRGLLRPFKKQNKS